MPGKLIVTGDINLMGVADPQEPFRHVVGALKSADVVFGNMECCLHLLAGRSHAAEGFFADPKVGGEGLQFAGVHAVGIANNVNYGTTNILSSIARLDEVGVLHTGAGPNLAAARAPAIIKRNGLSVGVAQRSSVYWPTDHEAKEDFPGIAVLKGHTAYHVPMGRLSPGSPPNNRPGVPPEIITWADAAYLAEFKSDLEALRPQVDILVASCHWGLGKEPLQYMTDIAHGAINAGADIVVGHGPHYSLPVELYKGKPIFYGLGNLCFKTGHLGRKHSNWLGMFVEVAFDGGKVTGVDFRFTRQNDRFETVFSPPAGEGDALADLAARSAKRGAALKADGDRIQVS